MPDIFVAEPKEKRPRLKKKVVGGKERLRLEKKGGGGQEKPSLRSLGKSGSTRVKKEIRKIVRDVGEKKAKGLLSYFIPLADFVKFPTQEEQEEIVLLLRRHPITNLSWMATAILMIFAPLALIFFPLLDFMPARFRLVTIIFWYLATIAFVFKNFLIWFFNVFIITDERVIDIDFVSLTYREITEAKIDKIEDITTKMGGPLQALFNFGDVIIQTAGEVPRLEFERVAKPTQVAKILNKLILQEEQEKLEGRVR